MTDYLTVEQARAKYVADHDLDRYPAEIRDMLTPAYPEGTREHAEYAAKLRAALANPAEVAAFADALPPIHNAARVAGIGL